MIFDKKFSLAVADPLYFMQFGPALVMSALETGNNLYLAVVDWADKGRSGSIWNLCVHMREVAASYPNVDFQVWVTSLPFKAVKESQKSVFYACARYHVANQLLQQTNDKIQIHSMDIDSIFMKPLDLPDVKLGLHFREAQGVSDHEKKGMRVLGHTILSTYCKDYVARVSQFCIDHNWDHWFLDQEALAECMTDIERAMVWDMKDHKLIELGTDGIDINYTTESKLWSGKGERKYKNMTYVNKFNEKHLKFFNTNAAKDFLLEDKLSA